LQRGASLVEVLNFLSLATAIGIVAMVGVARYVRHSRTAEAISSVEAIARGAAAYYEKSDQNQPAGSTVDAMRAMRHFPPSATATVPADVTKVQGTKYKSALGDWGASPWRELRFSIPQAQSFAYTFESEGAGQTAKAAAVARGDLDADGVWSEYRLGIRALDDGRAAVASEVERTNPED
jgi:type IV pilus assembly protein PilA